MGVLPDKGPGDSGADHPAVLIGGLGEEKHILRGAAPGGGVTPAQAAENDPLQVIHNPLETVPGDRAVPPPTTEIRAIWMGSPLRPAKRAMEWQTMRKKIGRAHV